MGTVTVVNSEYYVDGNHQKRRGTITMSSSYATGGDTVTSASFGLDRITLLNIGLGINSSNTANAFDMVPTLLTFQTAKVQMFGDGGNAPGGPQIEAANASNNSTVSANFEVQGY